VARALQCPNCGAKTSLAGLNGETFECEHCGQVLKVPAGARGASSSAPRSAGASPPPPRRSTTAAAPVAEPAPPARRAAAPSASAPVAAAPAATSVLPPEEPVIVRPPDDDGRAAPPPRIPRDALPLGVRIGAWVLAVPVGLAIVGIPARVLGYLTSQKLLDVFVKHNLSRFVPLIVIVVLWALATTILVEVFVEGGRWLMLRRRVRRGREGDVAANGDPDGAPAEPSAPRVPPRQRRSSRARGS
jgi:hypothetical protein